MFTMALAGRAVTDWTGDPGALVEYQVRFGRPVVVPDDDEGAEVTVRGKVGALLDDGRARVDLTVTSDGEKVLSLARAIVRLAMTAGAAGRSGRCRGAAPARLHLLRRHGRRAGRGRPGDPAAPPPTPRRGCPAAARASPIPTGPWSASTSGSPTTGSP